MRIDPSKYERLYEVRRRDHLERLIPRSSSQQLAIDVGSGCGYYSRLLSERGWKTTAIDSDAANIAACRECASETVLGDAVDALASLPEHRFALALALEIIEHMPKSQGEALLRQIARVLEPGGAMVLSTPNRFSPVGWGEYYWGEKIRGWEKWDAWDRTHVHIYASWEILALVRRCGFAVDRVVGYHYDAVLPLIGECSVPLSASSRFPLNRIGFNIMVACHKDGARPGRSRE